MRSRARRISSFEKRERGLRDVKGAPRIVSRALIVCALEETRELMTMAQCVEKMAEARAHASRERENEKSSSERPRP